MLESCVKILKQQELPGEEFGGSRKSICAEEPGLCFQIQNKLALKHPKDPVDAGFWIQHLKMLALSDA